ncbi:MAG: sulfotransferase family protein [Rickettsiales bacterium]|jgi:tetratricopeptide (TPR) repeat protein|nr:sulfotransferase family protein [Rickettsiales bacterium]
MTVKTPPVVTLPSRTTTANAVNTVEACLAHGNTLYQERKFSDALNYYTKALQLHPEHPILLAAMATTYAALAQHDNAASFYNRSLSYDPFNITTLVKLGKLYDTIGKTKDALSCFLEVIEKSPKTVEAYVLSAEVMEKMGLTKKALSLIIRTKILLPANANLLLIQAKLLRRLGEHKKALSLLQESLSITPPLPAARRYIAYAELAALQDAQGNYDAAYTASVKANISLIKESGLRETPALSVEHVANGIRNWLPTQNTASWGDVPKSPCKTPIFIIGFPCSGQAALHAALASSPDIVSTHEAPIIEKLIHGIPHILRTTVRYPQDIGTLDQNHILLLRQAYHQYAKQITGIATEQRQVLDNHPFNLIHLPLIYRMFPEALIILSVRDPRDAILQAFFQLYKPDTNTTRLASLHGAMMLYVQMMETLHLVQQHLHIQLEVVRHEDRISHPEILPSLLKQLGLRSDTLSPSPIIQHSLYRLTLDPLFPDTYRVEDYKNYFHDLVEHIKPCLDAYGYASA